MITSERRPLILKMLGIDSLDDIIKEIKSDKKEKDLIIKKLNQDVNDENGRDKIEKYKNEIKIIEKEKNNNELIINKLIEKNNILIKDFYDLEKKVQINKKQYEKNRDTKDKLLEKKNLYDEKEKIQNEIINLKNKIENRQKIIQEHKKRLSNFYGLDENIKSSEKKLDELYKQLEYQIKKIEQKNTLINRIKQEIEVIENKKNKIEKIGPNAKCPTCERVLANQYKNLILKFNSEKQKNVKEINIFLNDLKVARIEKEKLSREEHAFQKKKNYLKKKLQEKEKIETTINNINTELKEEQIELYKKENKLIKLKIIKFNITEFKNINKIIDKQYKKYQNIILLRDQKKDEINSLKINLERKKSEKNLILQKIYIINEKIKDISKIKYKIKEEKTVVKQLGILTDIMLNFRTHLISRIRPTLSNYSSDFFERMTDGKYNQIELDEDYNLLIFDNGNPYRIERFSGGEEDLANLCLRLAISEVITEKAGGVFNFIILDEIFGSQDIFRRQNIMKALNTLSSKFSQIFLITHLDVLKNDMENIIFVTENEDGISTIRIE
jgi:exonuclease SbcC